MKAITRHLLNAARTAIVSVGLCSWYSTSLAEVQMVALPADYADFALHPETGAVAALSAESNEAVFFRHADLAKGTAEPSATIRVGSTPCSVFYKQYQKTRVFAVVCSQDSHMYLINADGADKDKEFTLLKKVELNQSGVSYVTGSTNVGDPFVYYCYGGGHDSDTGVVSLRDLRSHGRAFDDSMDCAISASGKVAYRRGPWSPSGFESLIRTNSLADDKPSFSRLFYDHNSTAQYLPDPFDRYTAAGTQIFSRSLQRNEAGLDFTPMAFFRTRPLVVGIAGTDMRSRVLARARGGDQKVTLRAASYNTFTNVGDQVTLEYEPPEGERALPRGSPSHADFKRIAKRPRLFADDAREQVVYTDGARLYLVPLADFNLPDEPFLLATLDGSSEVFAGRENQLTLMPLDKRAKITLDDMPEGMKADGDKLRWKPASDQIGPATLVATIAHGDIQRTLRFDLNVTFPSMKLPFAPANFAAAADGKRIVIWEGPTLDRFGRPQGNASATAARIAVIDVATGKVAVERQVAEQIGSSIVTDRYLILRPALQGSPKCEILRISDLQRAKSLVASGPILHVDAVGKILVIQTQSGIEVYDATSFKRLKAFAAAGSANQSAVSEHGLFVQGVLYGFDLKPKLIANAAQLPALGGVRNNAAASFMAGAVPFQQQQQQARMRHMAGSNGQARIATQSVPGADIQVSLDIRRQQLQVPGATHTWRTEFEVSLTASGAIDERQVVLREQLHAQTAGQVPAPATLLQVARREALVVHGKRLYRWPIPAAKDEAGNSSDAMVWLPQQSSLVLTGTGETELKHTLRGGKRPVQFSALTSFEAISIDEATGVVTVDDKAIFVEAAEALEGQVKQRNRGESFVQTLRNQATPMIEHATLALGRRPKGFPVAVPIHVSASDTDLASASLQYFVIAEIPSAKFLERLRQLDSEREKQLAEMQAARDRAKLQAQSGRPGEGDTEMAEVKRKLDALEQRLDLITRQLNMLLKKLDEKE